MSQTIQLPDICEFMTRHLVDVFDTMLAMPAALAPKAGLPHFDERVTGSVGFAGDAVTGAVYLHLSAAFANRVAAAMLGLPPEEAIGETDVNDAADRGFIGEVETDGELLLLRLAVGMVVDLRDQFRMRL